MAPCFVCGQTCSKLCGRCHSRVYCGAECQRKDWSLHKPICGVAKEHAINLVQKVLSRRLATVAGDELSNIKQDWFLAVFPELRESYSQEPTEEQKLKLTALLTKAGSSQLEHVWRRDGQGLSRWQRPNLQLLCDHGARLPYLTQDVQFAAGSCHGGAASIVTQDRHIGTGFGLEAESKSWVPHSWEVRDGKVVELTSQTYKCYWGIILSDEQALEFAKLYSVQFGDTRQRIWKSGIIQNKANGFGLFYFQCGVERLKKDPQTALILFEAGAALEHPDAQHNLGACYSQGLCGAPQDAKTAMVYFELAASQGLVAAKCDLGACYYSSGDYVKAVEHFEIAADKGNACAQYSLFRCYSEGTGVPQDMTKAAHFLDLAARQNHPQAVQLLGKFKARGTKGKPNTKTH